MDMQLKSKRGKEEKMSRGIIQAAVTNNRAFQARELSQSPREVSSEQPTLADLLLPGTGHAFSDEFACLLNVLSEGRRICLTQDRTWQRANLSDLK